jgi:hypothetical protein
MYTDISGSHFAQPAHIMTAKQTGANTTSAVNRGHKAGFTTQFIGAYCSILSFNDSSG